MCIPELRVGGAALTGGRRALNGSCLSHRQLCSREDLDGGVVWSQALGSSPGPGRSSRMSLVSDSPPGTLGSALQAPSQLAPAL